MLLENRLRFFLGANSPGGFYSLYDHLIDLETASDVYILKGGPGCGKSTFLKQVASRAEDSGIEVEYIHCSSDPSSLDAIIISELKTAIVDGTSPHVVEPSYPYAVEKYINLGDYYDASAIKAKKAELKDALKRYRECFAGVYRHISAARIIHDEMFDTVLNHSSIEKIKKRVRGIIRREIRGKGDGAFLKKRFLSGLSPVGYITYFETAGVMCDKIFEISDSFGYSHFCLSNIMEAALASSYMVYACYSPLNPEHQLEHLFIPELSLGFVTTNAQLKFGLEPFRRVRLDAAIPADILHDNRQRLRFERRTASALVDEAIASLKAAKDIHDEIENLYNPHVDFDGVSLAAKSLSDALLG